MSYTSPRFRTYALTVALFSPSLTAAAWAQAQAPSSVTPAAESGIEDIVVTARKTAEASQTVPVAITALSQAGLERKVVLSAQDLQLSVPGLFVAPNSQGGAPTFAIRAAKADNGTSATVTTYINDMPTASTLAISRMIYDMQSVTTLKGPQGTLFGANSTGGAIIFRPNTPTDKLEGYLEGGLGNFSRRTLEGVINLPVSDMLALRVAGNFVRRDGFVTNNATAAQRGRSSEEFSDNRYESGRFSAKLTPSDAVQNDLMVSYFHENDKPTQAIPVFLRPRFNYATFLGFSVPVDYAKAGIFASPDERNVTQGSDPTYNKAKIWAITNATTVDLSADLTAKLALGYEHDDLDTFESNSGTVGTVVNGRSRDRLRQYTIEPSFDYNGADGKLRVKVGAFYSHLKRETGNSYGVIGLPFDLTGFPAAAAGAVNAFLPLLNISLYKRNLNSKALFSQVSYDLTETLTATVGARYTWDKGKYAANNYNKFGGAATTANIGAFGPPNALPADCAAGLATYKNFDAATCTGHQDYKTSSPSFTATLENKFSQTTMGYATVRSGYLVGGFNNQVFVPGGFAQVFKPEKVLDAELGFKSDWRLGDQPIRTNVDIFYGRYRNQQRVQNGTTSTGTTFIAVQNAGKSHFYGTDVEVIYSPADVLELSANYQYVHAVYDQYLAPLNIPGVNNAFVNFKGHKLSQTPEHVVNTAATFKVPMSDSYGKLSATLSYFWRSKTTGHDAPTVSGTTLPSGELQTITTDYSQYDELRSFGLVNLSVNWTRVMDTNFDLKFWVKNLTDKTYAVYQSNQLLQYGYATYTYGNPREIGVNVRYAF